jgi:hypothetical protein
MALASIVLGSESRVTHGHILMLLDTEGDK